jgi:nucleoid DNA-binding protein
MNEKLDKDLLVRALADRCNYTISDTKNFLDNLISLFGECIENDTSIDVRGFGHLYIQILPERKGFKPITGKPGEGTAMWYPKTKRVIFRLASNLRRLTKKYNIEIDL